MSATLTCIAAHVGYGPCFHHCIPAGNDPLTARRGLDSTETVPILDRFEAHAGAPIPTPR